LERRREIVAALKASKEYRDGFCEGLIRTGFPFQIRSLRLKQGLSQHALGKRAGMAQAVISRHENPGYGRLTLKSALRLAAALEVGLVMRCVPYSELVDWAVYSTTSDLVVPKFSDDSRLDEPHPPLAIVVSSIGTPQGEHEAQAPPGTRFNGQAKSQRARSVLLGEDIDTIAQHALAGGSH
jgi:transcriptional regulator with XRE-family HTH domain